MQSSSFTTKMAWDPKHLPDCRFLIRLSEARAGSTKQIEPSIFIVRNFEGLGPNVSKTGQDAACCRRIGTRRATYG